MQYELLFLHYDRQWSAYIDEIIFPLILWIFKTFKHLVINNNESRIMNWKLKMKNLWIRSRRCVIIYDLVLFWDVQCVRYWLMIIIISRICVLKKNWPQTIQYIAVATKIRLFFSLFKQQKTRWEEKMCFPYVFICNTFVSTAIF